MCALLHDCTAVYTVWSMGPLRPSHVRTPYTGCTRGVEGVAVGSGVTVGNERLQTCFLVHLLVRRTSTSWTPRRSSHPLETRVDGMEGDGHRSDLAQHRSCDAGSGSPRLDKSDGGRVVVDGTWSRSSGSLGSIESPIERSDSLNYDSDAPQSHGYAHSQPPDAGSMTHISPPYH